MQHRPSHPFRSFVSTIAALATILAPYATLVPVAHAASLFSDGFETNDFSLWTSVDSPNWNTTPLLPHSGARTAIVRGDTGPTPHVLRKDISTAGYENIVLSYWYRKNVSIDASDFVRVQWYDGSAWNTLFTINNSVLSGWQSQSHTLPVEAVDNPSFRIRFGGRISDTSEAIRLDDVSLTGDPLPTTGTLIVEKQIVGGAAFDDFSFKVNGDDPITFEEDGTNTFTEQVPGPYVIWELPDPHYTTTYGEDCDVDGNIEVVAGETKTCVITNTYVPFGTLTVHKVIEGNSDAEVTDFAFSIAGNGPYTLQADGTQVDVPQGTHVLSEDPSDYSEFSTVTYSGNCGTEGDITIEDGGTYECTITNNITQPQPPLECEEGYHLEGDVCVPDEEGGDSTATIHVVKYTVGGDGSFGFSVSGNEESDQMDIQTVDSEGVADFTVHPGDGASYTVTEDAAPGWDLSLAPDCEYDNQEAGFVVVRGYTVELDADDEVTCTFTNTLQSASPTPEPTAHITVIKQTEGGDGEFSFNGPEVEEGFSISTEDGSGSEVLGVSPNGDGTSYTIEENAQDGWNLDGFVCEYDGEPEESPSPSVSPSPSASPSPSPSPEVLSVLEDPFIYDESSVQMTLYPGDEVTCTFMNSTDGDGGNEGGSGHDSGPASSTLIIEKVIVNGADASVSFSNFSFTVDGDSYQFEEDGSNKLKLDSGDYTVVEDPFAGSEATYSGDCDEQGNISMVSDETYTCTITNTFAVGGFNPGDEPTPTPTPVPPAGENPNGGSSDNGNGTPGGTTAGDQGGPDVSESPAPSASQSDDNALTTAAIGNLAGLPCVPGGAAWAILNLAIYLLTVVWLQRGPFSWLRALVLLAVATVLLSWFAATCGNDPQWLSGVLALVSLLWLRLRGKK